jgi:hypothetical protein
VFLNYFQDDFTAKSKIHDKKRKTKKDMTKRLVSPELRPRFIFSSDFKERRPPCFKITIKANKREFLVT